MKKCLTVLLVIAVMFTFSFGSAFAANAPDPASTSASSSQEAFSKFIADTLKLISYDGNGYATNISAKSTINYADGYLSREAIESAAKLYENEYLAKIGEATSDWDSIWVNLTESDVISAIASTSAVYRAWYTQAELDIAKARTVLATDLSGYSATARKAIEAVIDTQTETLDKAIKDQGDTTPSQAYIDKIRNVVTAVEKALKDYSTTEDDNKTIADARAAATKTLSDATYEFDIAAEKYFENPTSAEDAAKKASYDTDFDKMVAYYEDLIDDAVLNADDKAMDTAAEVVAKLNEIASQIKATFAATAPFTGFYTDLDILAQGDLLVNYANNNAVNAKAQRNNDGTLTYDPIDVDKALADALKKIEAAVYDGVKTNSKAGLTISLATLNIAKGDYSLQAYKKTVIDTFTTGDYDKSKWSGDRKTKVKDLQDEYADKILVATSVSDIDALAKEVKAALDGILTDSQISSLRTKVNNRLSALGYDSILNNYYDAVAGSVNSSSTAKSDAIAAAKKVFQDAVIAQEDKDITYTEINQIIANNRDAALAKLVDVKTKDELNQQANALVEQFKTLPTSVTLADKDTILAAQQAFDNYLALAGTQKSDVSNNYLLKNAMTSLMNLEARAVRDQIRALPKTVTVNDAEAINAARAAYDALETTYGAYDNETGAKKFNYLGAPIQNQVTNYNTLTTAETNLEKAKIEDAAKKITALNSYSTVAEIKAAQEAFNALKLESKLSFNDELFAKLTEAVAGIADDDFVKSYLQNLSIVARSVKTASGNIKVTINADVQELKDAGYTVEYKFYRSTKPRSNYGKARMIKTENVYTNTTGTKGVRYYYKAMIQVKDADGNIVATTPLSQCKYACRVK